MTRRVALALAFCVLLSSVSGCSAMNEGHGHKTAADKLGWKLGCQAWTFRKLTLFETLDTLQSLGIHYIEIYPGQKLSPEQNGKFDHNASDEQIAAFLAKAKSADVTPVSYGVVGLKNDEADARKVFEFGKKLGLKNIVSEPPEDALPMLDKLANEYKINLAIHNHPKPSHYWDCATTVKAIANTSNRVGSCADIGHWYRSGLTPVDCVKNLQGRIIEFHFKDIDAAKEDVPWGTGVVNTTAVLAEMKRQKFEGVLSIEYERTEGAELIANVKKCVEYFNAQTEMLSK